MDCDLLEGEMKPIKVKFPWYKLIYSYISEFFRILSGKEYCVNYSIFFDYECEYCYKLQKSFKKSDWYMTKFKPVEGNDKFRCRLKRAIKSLSKIKN